LKLIGIAVLLALALLLTLAAFRLPILESLHLIQAGAFGSSAGFARTLVKAIPLLLTGLGMVVAWRAGMYNIGGEGQFIFGGIAGAALFKFAPQLPPTVLNLAILVVAAIAGGLYAALAGWLQISRGVQVVISTILLNFVAIQALDWSVSGPLQEAKKQLPLSDRLPDAAMMLRFSSKTDLHSGVFLALIMAGFLFLFLFFTKPGFVLRLVGENPSVARANRIDAGLAQLGAMTLSGALCGLAAGVEYTGLAGQIGTGFSQNWGFMAIPVALLGALHPLGVILSAGYFGALFAGTENLARFTPAGSTIIFVIQAVAVLAFVGADRLLKKRPAVSDANE
jgi:general nucleoside transport system permease protein